MHVRIERPKTRIISMIDAIAIDFGTSRTKLAYWDPRSKAVRLMRLGEREETFVPSLFYLMRDGERVLWGEEAAEMLAEDPPGIVAMLKRHLRNRYIYANRRKLRPVELLACLFEGLRGRAGREIVAFEGAPPRKVLLTLPALFGPADEQILKGAVISSGKLPRKIP
jgi:molecular chaperone DnaK (HSP70)